MLSRISATLFSWGYLQLEFLNDDVIFSCVWYLHVSSRRMRRTKTNEQPKEVEWEERGRKSYLKLNEIQLPFSGLFSLLRASAMPHRRNFITPPAVVWHTQKRFSLCKWRMDGRRFNNVLYASAFSPSVLKASSRHLQQPCRVFILVSWLNSSSHEENERTRVRWWLWWDIRKINHRWN